MAKQFGSAKITIDIVVNESLKQTYDSFSASHKKLEREIIKSTNAIEAKKSASNAKIQAMGTKAADNAVSNNKRVSSSALSEQDKIDRDHEKAIQENLALEEKRLTERIKIDNRIRKNAERESDRTSKAQQKAADEFNKAWDNAYAEDKRRTDQAAKAREQFLKRQEKALESNRRKWSEMSKEVGRYATALLAVEAAIAGSLLKAQGDLERANDLVVAKTIAASDSAEMIAGKYQKLDDEVTRVANKFGLLGTEVALSGQFIAQATGDIDKTVSALEAITRLKLVDPFTDVRTASDFVTDALDAVGASYDDVGAIVDQVAFTVSNFNTDITQNAESTKVGAAAFREFAKTGDDALDVMSELQATIGTLANRGLKGSIATRALSTSMIRLLDPTAEGKKQMDELGISFTDAEGNFVGVIEAVGVLEDKLKGANDETRAAALSAIVGAEAFKQWSTLIEVGSDQLTRYQTEIQNSTGFTEKAASVVRDNLATSFEQLQAAVVNTSADLAGLRSGAVKDMVDGLTDLIVSVQSFTDEDKEMIVNIGVTTIKLTALAAVFTKVFIPALIAADARAKTFALTSATQLKPSLLGVKDAAATASAVLVAFGVGWQIGNIISDITGLSRKFLELGESIGKVTTRVDTSQLQRGIEDIGKAIDEQVSKRPNLDFKVGGIRFEGVDEASFKIITDRISQLEKRDFGSLSIKEAREALAAFNERLQQTVDLEKQRADVRKQSEIETLEQGLPELPDLEVPEMDSPLSPGFFDNLLSTQENFQQQSTESTQEYLSRMFELLVGSAELRKTLGEASDLDVLEARKNYYQLELDALRENENTKSSELAEARQKLLDADNALNEERAEVLKDGLLGQLGIIEDNNELSIDAEKAFTDKLVGLLQQYGLDGTEVFKQAKNDQKEVQGKINQEIIDAEKAQLDSLNRFADQVQRDVGSALGKMLSEAESFEDSMKSIFKSVATGLAGLALGPFGGSFVGSLLGGFGFAKGGVMTSSGPATLPVKGYASGGVATSPQLAVFGEGSKPEAFVPLPDGRSIPVTLNMPNSAGNVNNTRNNNDNRAYNTVVNQYFTINEVSDARKTAMEINRLADRREPNSMRLRGM